MARTVQNRVFRIWFFAAAMLMLCRISFAQEWSITTADFQTQQVQLRSFSADGFGVTSVDTKSQRTISLDQFVSLYRPGVQEPAVPAFTLTLVGGDRLVGAPGPVVHEKLSWSSPSLGTMMVPFNQLVSISKGLNLSPSNAAPRQDVVMLGNGDTVAGVFTDCTDGKISLQTDAGASAIPLDSIRQVCFAITSAAASDHSHGYRLHLSDGSIVTVSEASLDGDHLAITLPGKEATKLNLPLASVLGIEQINGPVNWLSSLQPAEEIQTPYLSGAPHWPARFDRAVDGSPLSFDGQIYEHGIGVHAYSRLTFAIDPQWTVFRTQYAIDSSRDQPRRFADVTVRVLLDGKCAVEQAHFREGVLSAVVMLDVKSAKTLTLECDYGNAGDTQAHLDWLQPAFLRAMPTTAPAAATSQPDHE